MANVEELQRAKNRDATSMVGVVFVVPGGSKPARRIFSANYASSVSPLSRHRRNRRPKRDPLYASQPAAWRADPVQSNQQIVQENRDGGFLGPHSPSCSPKGAGQMGALVEAGRAWGQQASYGLCEPSPAPAAGSQLQELGASGGPRSWLQHDGGETALQRKGAPCVEDSNREEA